MNKIKNLKNFINEDYSIGSILKKGKEMVSGWVSNLRKKIASAIPAEEGKPGDGNIKIIPSGSKKGLPMVAYFSASSDESIQDQVAKFYSKQSIEEAMSPKEIQGINPRLLYPGGAGVEDVNAEDLKNILTDRFETFDMVNTFKDENGNEIESTGYNKPIFIFGAPGIGKTEIVAQVCDALGVDLMPVDLQFMEPADFLGIPSTVDIASDEKYGAGVTRNNPPIWLPQNNNGEKYKDKGGIIFFDELNRANEFVQNGMMNLAQQRRVNTYKLPSKWLIVAAGNRKEDTKTASMITELDTAFVDRFTIVNYVPTIEGFRKHVLESPRKLKDALGATLSEIILPELLTFLEFSREYFHTLNPESEEIKFATPRGWVDASKAYYSKLKIMEKKGKLPGAMSDEEFKRTFAQEVGKTAANAFAKFYMISKNYPIENIYKVFDDPKKAPPLPKKGGGYDPEKAYAILAAIVSKSVDFTPLKPEQFANAVDFAISIDDPEYATSFLKMLLSKHPYMTKDSKYMRHMAKYNDKYLAQFDDV